MANMASLSWVSPDVQHKASSVDEALRVVLQVDAEHQGSKPIAMEVVRENGESMMAVLGAERCALNWFPKEYNGTGSYHTIAEGFDPDASRIGPKPEVITYFFYGHHSEVPLEYTVPKDDAFDAWREFVLRPGRPQSVRWDLD